MQRGFVATHSTRVTGGDPKRSRSPWPKVSAKFFLGALFWRYSTNVTLVSSSARTASSAGFPRTFTQSQKLCKATELLTLCLEALLGDCEDAIRALEPHRFPHLQRRSPIGIAAK